MRTDRKTDITHIQLIFVYIDCFIEYLVNME